MTSEAPESVEENGFFDSEPNDGSAGVAIDTSTSGIEKRLADIEGITGTPIRKKRGRKPKAETTESEKPAPSFDAAQIQGTLTLAYFELIGIIARRPIPKTPEKEETVGELLVYCVNKYIPGDSQEHLPLITLAFITVDLIRSARKPVIEESEAFENANPET